ncbi:MAG: DNRLRE domain-containing protein [Candidatus Cloacimonetes bacterium]|nr:DNRLRE domain-containing protein [Candidatus Cloacimonadota bacterium]
MKIISLVLVLFFCISLLLADEIQFFPSDDMYTDCDGVSHSISDLFLVNEGASDYETIMVKFDLSEYGNDPFTSATLNLHRFFACGGGGGTTSAKLYLISEDWDETAWDQHTHISYNEETEIEYVFSGPTGAQNTWYEIDITNFVMLWLYANQPNYGLCIVADAGEHHSKFDSKEDSNENFHPYFSIQTTTKIDENKIINVESNISMENYPNPFNPQTTIEFTSKITQEANISIYNIKGEKIITLFDGLLTANETYRKIWNGSSENGNTVNSGIYFSKIKTKSDLQVKKIILLK